MSVIFKGREELPEWGGGLDQYGQSRLLTPDEPPVYSSPADYHNWCQRFDPDPNPSEQRECLVASASPLGVVDAAIALHERGLGSDRLARLDQLRAKLRDDLVDKEVRGLYDSMFACASLPSSGGSREQGLIEVSLALAGNSDAEAVVETKRQQQYQLDQAKYLEIYGGEPGRHLDPDQLEQLRQQNLVVVHTTRTQPAGRLYPVAAYNRNDPRHVPRCSIHTSINHPVASHMWGNFENKDFTVVSPLAEIVAINGIPDVCNSVDTYFSVEPAEGLELPPETIIIQLNADQESLTEIDGRTIKVRQGPVLRADIDSLALTEQRLSPGDQDWSVSPKSIVAELTGDVDDLLQSELKSLLYDGHSLLWAEGGERAVSELESLSKLAHATVAETDETPADTNQLAHQLVAVYLNLDRDRAAGYPAMTGALQEATRQFLVRRSIRFLGGFSVEAGPHYSSNQTLESSLRDTAQGLGLRQGLHADQLESLFEKAAFVAKEDLFSQRASIPDIDPDNDYQKYQRLLDQSYQRERWDGLWHVLEGLRPVWRHAAIAGDFLPYAPPPAEPEPPAGQLELR